MSKFSPLFFLLFCPFLSALAQFSGPESVEYHSPSHTYFVSNTTTDVIRRVWPGGNVSIFAPASLVGSSSPHGLEIVGDTLYVCTGSRLRAFRLADSTLLFNVNLNASFLNGITHDNDGYLYITDFSSPKIYRFNTQTRAFNIMVASPGGTPNGIIYDPYDGINPRLVFVTWGANAAVKAVSMADSSINTLVTTSLTNIDGICKGRNGTFYLASWTPDRITAYDSTFTGAPVTISNNVSNPADICYNFDGDTIAVPNTGNNTVTYIGLLITGTGEQEISDVQLYPNPAASELRIHFLDNQNKYFIQIYSYMGTLVKSMSIRNNESIDISALQQGQYLIEIQSENGQLSRRKFMVCR
jgi:hypothetical protein